MKEVGRDSSVHPTTVTELSRRPERRTRRYNGRRSNVASSSSYVHPAWATAREAAGGDTRRLEVLDETTIFIHNDPDWRRAKR